MNISRIKENEAWIKTIRKQLDKQKEVEYRIAARLRSDFAKLDALYAAATEYSPYGTNRCPICTDRWDRRKITRLGEISGKYTELVNMMCREGHVWKYVTE